MCFGSLAGLWCIKHAEKEHRCEVASARDWSLLQCWVGHVFVAHATKQRICYGLLCGEVAHQRRRVSWSIVTHLRRRVAWSIVAHLRRRVAWSIVAYAMCCPQMRDVLLHFGFDEENPTFEVSGVHLHGLEIEENLGDASMGSQMRACGPHKRGA